MTCIKKKLVLNFSRSIIMLMSTFLSFSAAQQAVEFPPRVAELTTGVDSLEKARSLYGNGAETTVQDIHSWCYYVEQDRGYLSVSSFEHENRIRSIALTTFTDVAPGCQRARIVGRT
jgi:hypothetical protein